jgi:hypothetical protein
MHGLRRYAAMIAAAAAFIASPASAQFYFKSPNVKGAPVTGAEPGIVGQALPGATPKELRAALVWNLRAALNVAALQCQFEPTLLTRTNYNTLLRDHEGELKSSYEVLAKYFERVAPSKKAGQTELDRYGTRIYSGFSTVHAQLTFCQTADSISRQALFAPRGSLSDVAERRMRELRNSLVIWGEQQFPGGYHLQAPAIPRFNNEKCWRKDVYEPGRCVRG